MRRLNKEACGGNLPGQVLVDRCVAFHDVSLGTSSLAEQNVQHSIRIMEVVIQHLSNHFQP